MRFTPYLAPLSSMRLSFAAFSELGPRPSNEDRYLEPTYSENGSVVTAIADGIGGAAGGGDAAHLAIEAVKSVGADPSRLDAIFQEAVRLIRQKALEEPDKARMGTTLSVAAIAGDELHVAHVGDTRIYHLRARGLKNLTEDQTEVAELLRRGVLSESQARRYPRRNVLLSALTAKGDYEVYHNRARVNVGDRIVLLTDGVYQKIKRGSVLNSSLAHLDVRAFLHDLEMRTGAAEPSDNYTALALQIEEL